MARRAAHPRPPQSGPPLRQGHVGTERGRRARRGARRLAPAMSDAASRCGREGRWLAVDVGGTNMRAAIVGGDGVVGERKDRPTERSPEPLVALAREVLAGDADTVDGAVVGLPGRIDYGAGT